MSSLTLQTTISERQLISLLDQLSADEKLKIANLLRAQVAKDRWQALSKELPDAAEISMDEIVAEVKAVRSGV